MGAPSLTNLLLWSLITELKLNILRNKVHLNVDVMSAMLKPYGLGGEVLFQIMNTKPSSTRRKV